MRRAFILALACAALAAAAEDSATPQASARRVWADESTNLLGLPSADGSLLSYVDPATGDLAVYELRNGSKRRLTDNPPGAKTFAYFSVISPDKRRVAYAWFNEQGFYELWVADVEGGSPRRLYRNPEAGFVQPCDWSPDGTSILTLFFRKDNVSQIALVSADDGSVTTLKTLSWFYPKKMSFSPDGRYILYDSILSRRETPRDILLLRADGSEETTLIEHEANDIFPVWTPDGKAVAFASDRAGDMDLWLQDVEDGVAVGEPRRIARSLGRALPMGVTRDGRYYFGLRTGRSDVMITGLDAGDEPERVGLRTAGRNTAPAWSPDGRRLAYLTQLGTENYGRESRGVAVWVPETQQETVLRPRLAYISRLEWSPDGSALLASGSDGLGRSGLYSVNPDTGAVSPFVRIPGGAPGGFAGTWTPDGKAVFYVEPESSAIRRFTIEDRLDEEIRPEKKGAPNRLAVSPDGRSLAFTVGDAVWVRDLESGGERRLTSQQDLRGIGWTADGKALHLSAPAKLWRIDLEGVRRPVAPAMKHEGDVVFDPGGRRVAYSVNDQRAEVWALENWMQ